MASIPQKSPRAAAIKHGNELKRDRETVRIKAKNARIKKNDGKLAQARVCISDNKINIWMFRLTTKQLKKSWPLERQSYKLYKK